MRVTRAGVALAACLVLTIAAEALRAAPSSTMTPLERAYATFYAAAAAVGAGAALVALALTYGARSRGGTRAALALAGFATALVAVGLAIPESVYAFTVQRGEFSADVAPLGRVWLAARYAPIAAGAVLLARAARRSLAFSEPGARLLALSIAGLAALELLLPHGGWRAGALAGVGAGLARAAWREPKARP